MPLNVTDCLWSIVFKYEDANYGRCMLISEIRGLPAYYTYRSGSALETHATKLPADFNARRGLKLCSY